MNYVSTLLILIAVSCSSKTQKEAIPEDENKSSISLKVDSTMSDVAVPSLILQPGEAREMPAERYEYEKVIIPPGATLNITEGSSALLHLIVRDSFLLQGIIYARNFSTQETQEYINVPGQNPVMVQYRNTNKGGDGGAGGLGGSNPGGSGALGTTDYGGGGGSGGGRLSRAYAPYIVNFPGRDANGQAGAGVPGFCGAGGGRGTTRSDYGNGGIVYLEAYGYFDGTGGVVNLAGTQGTGGLNGGIGAYSTQTHGCQTGGGGGGGGAPGGHGGFLIGYFAGELIGYPRASVIGGKGGTGGLAPGETRARGTVGSNGQAGVSGKVLFYKKP